jgi:hypothetical protein
MNKKKFEAEHRRLGKFPDLSPDERILFAMSLSANPDERWGRHEGFLRSHGLFTSSARKAFKLESILKSKQALRRPKDLAHIPLIRQVLRLRKTKPPSVLKSK